MSPANPHKYTILAVDDTPENLDVVKGLLQEEYVVKVAINGALALKIAEANPPDLILLDVMMPGLDGYQVCQRLKENPDTRHVPIIFLTAKKTVEDEYKGFGLGAADYITKPIAPPILKARVRAQIQLKVSFDQLAQSEKLAALGQLMAGVAHEMNTPLGAVQSSAELIEEVLLELVKAMAQQHCLETGTWNAILSLLAKNPPMLTSGHRRERAQTFRQAQNQLGWGLSEEHAVLWVSLVDDLEDPAYVALAKEPNQEGLHQLAEPLIGLRRGIHRILTATGRTTKTVFALRSYTHFAQNQPAEAIDLAQSLDTVLTLFHSPMKQGIELVTRIEPVPPILGQADEINQIWTNLIQNALHATGYQGRLEIEAKRSGDWALVNIIDDGPGVPAAIKDRIFEPFYTTKPVGQGSGLGLDIVKRIVENHRGQIELTSEPGAGCKVSVRLPLSQREKPS